ncbi:MAG: hypothetical protein KAJ24_03215, partial [Candidatus Aenigmarchaeota archaeon]|nr:hypothetical protein [Candidatus Aenigmarchaeota archaeon]
MKKKTMLILGSIVFVLLLANLSIALESEPTETITYTASTETHCSCGICWIALYSDARNQKDENNIFKPYAEVTKLIYDNGKLKIKWNDTEAFDKEIDLETVIFTGDEQFEPKDFPDNMNYSIDIENKKFNYKYDLSFNLPANDLVIALDMNTDFDYEVFNDYVNVGPHKFGFSDAINENYTISIGTYINKADKEVIRINISRDWVADGFSVGDDVVIDPTIQLKEPNTEVLDDSWISLANPSTNYGSDSDMWINQSTKYAFLGFNITSILGYHEVIDASLNIYGLSSSSGTSYISEYDNQTWTEESITWNNYCSGCVGSILDSASTVTSEFKEYNVTTWVSDEFGNLNNKVSFFYNTTYISATSGYRTATKEYDVDTSRRPYLNITYISNIAPTIGLEVEPTDPSTYVNGAYYQFNITACDVDGYADLSEVIFEWNSANTTITDSVNINASCSEYYVVKSGLDAGNHNWKWYANDSESEWANVISDTWTLNKANPSFSSSVTTPITYGAASDYSASESNAGDTGCTYTLYRNGSSIDTGSSVGDTTVLGVSSYNYTYSTAGCTNYNVGSDYKALVVNKATPSFTTSVTTPINYGTASDYSGSESNAGDNDCTYTLYRNGSSIDTGSSVSDTSVLSGR